MTRRRDVSELAEAGSPIPPGSRVLILPPQSDDDPAPDPQVADAAALGRGGPAIDAEARESVIAEAMARMTADEKLQDNIDAEKMGRKAADTALGDRIDALPAPPDVSGFATEADLTAEEEARAADDTAIRQLIAALPDPRDINDLPAGVSIFPIYLDGGGLAWSNKVYAPRALVTNDGGTYVCILSTQGKQRAETEPGTGTAWETYWARIGGVPDVALPDLAAGTRGLYLRQAADGETWTLAAVEDATARGAAAENARVIATQNDRMTDLHAGPPATSWTDAMASQGGIAPGPSDGSDPSVAYARAVSGWQSPTRSGRPDAERQDVVRVLKDTNPSQVRVLFVDRDDSSLIYHSPLQGEWHRIGSDAADMWDYYTSYSAIGAGVGSLTLQLTSSAEHVGASRFAGTLTGAIANGLVTLASLASAVAGRLLPTGGTANQALAKTANNQAVAWRAVSTLIADRSITVRKLSAQLIGRLLPTGGADDQLLGRAKGAPAWVDAAAGGMGGGGGFSRIGSVWTATAQANSNFRDTGISLPANPADNDIYGFAASWGGVLDVFRSLTGREIKALPTVVAGAAAGGIEIALEGVDDSSLFAGKSALGTMMLRIDSGSDWTAADFFALYDFDAAAGGRDPDLTEIVLDGSIQAVDVDNRDRTATVALLEAGSVLADYASALSESADTVTLKRGTYLVAIDADVTTGAASNARVGVNARANMLFAMETTLVDKSVRSIQITNPYYRGIGSAQQPRSAGPENIALIVRVPESLPVRLRMGLPSQSPTGFLRPRRMTILPL